MAFEMPAMPGSPCSSAIARKSVATNPIATALRIAVVVVQCRCRRDIVFIVSDSLASSFWLLNDNPQSVSWNEYRSASCNTNRRRTGVPAS